MDSSAPPKQGQAQGKESAGRSPAHRSAPPRASFRERRQAERTRSRVRVAARVRTPMSPAVRARDPLPPMRTSRTGLGRLGRLVAFLAAAAAFHGAVVVLGLVIGGGEGGRREVVRQEVKIEVHERKVEPPPPPVEKPPEPERPVPPPPPPKVVKAPPPPAPPPPVTKGPPPRVVGLSMESTVEGGGGPAFAVGNTREGETAERAVAAKDLAPAPPAPAAPVVAAATSNRAATRIPTAGVSYTQAQQKKKVEPIYPETLKVQGIEADVSVMVSIDETGKVTKVKILREAPYPEFNEAARKAAFAQQWEPFMRDGVPFAGTVSYRILFRVEEAQ